MTPNFPSAHDSTLRGEGQGRATPLYEQTLQARVRVLGGDHLDTLGSRNNLAGVYESAGDLRRAIALYEQTLDDAVRVLAADHPTTRMVAANLADAVKVRAPDDPPSQGHPRKRAGRRQEPQSQRGRSLSHRRSVNVPAPMMPTPSTGLDPRPGS
jgi:hypothetical protein